VLRTAELCCVTCVQIAHSRESELEQQTPADSVKSQVLLSSMLEVVGPNKAVVVQDDCCAAFSDLSLCRECQADNKSVCRFHSFRRYGATFDCRTPHGFYFLAD